MNKNQQDIMVLAVAEAIVSKRAVSWIFNSEGHMTERYKITLNK